MSCGLSPSVTDDYSPRNKRVTPRNRITVRGRFPFFPSSPFLYIITRIKQVSTNRINLWLL